MVTGPLIAGPAFLGRVHAWPLPRVVRDVAMQLEIGQVLRESTRWQGCSDQEVRSRALALRAAVQEGEDIRRLVVPVYGLVREICRRKLGMAHHPVQIRGALVMARGNIAEMQTGEGKTLTALMPIVLGALDGRGAHVMTSNEYLAKRDAEFARPVLEEFGLTVGYILHAKPQEERARAYQQDVTYGTEKQFGFDFLIDTMTLTKAFGTAAGRREGAPCPGLLQRGHHFALVDEADSILIDQASTPLIISCPQPCPPDEQVLFRWCDATSAKLIADRHYRLDREKRSAKLTQAGCRSVLLTGRPPQIGRFPTDRLFAQVERSLVARECYRGERDYIVLDGKVEIVDEGTGRVLPGRKWQDGLQQAIEVQAGVAFSDPMGTAARITLQSYMKKYGHLCGMTGTATDVADELRAVYRVAVQVIPPHRRCQRKEGATRVFSTLEAKLAAVTEEIGRLVAAGRSVLVGTSSVHSSELCAKRLADAGITAQVLHARHHEQEARIVEAAGEPGMVTVATNMAGRGTDIKLHESVRTAGGLHVLAIELNSSARVDRQLVGRSARQGDPGSFQFFVSLEDDLLRALGPERHRRLMESGRRRRRTELPASWVKPFYEAQILLEQRGERDRGRMLQQETRQLRMFDSLGLDPHVDLLTDTIF